MAKRIPAGPVVRAAPKKLRIALRLRDWSEWARQVFRGVQSFAHSKPDWQLHVVTGISDSGLDVGHIEWDGVITHILYDVRGLGRLWRAGRTKIVSFTSVPPTALSSLPSVRVDDSAIVRAVGQHLISGGFRKFAYHLRASKVRIEDYRCNALMEFAKSVDCPCDVGPRRFTKTDPLSKASLKRWIAALDKPVGILAWSMSDAIGIVQACLDGEISIPEQVAVVAWDDDSLLAESVTPSVSGVVLPAEKLGHEAAKLLDRLLSGAPGPNKPVIVQPSGLIHIRQSSDASMIADRDVHLANRYIMEHAADPLAVKQLIGELHVSRSKLERDFWRVNGRTLNQAIVAAHLERAKQLLVETDWPLHRVARRAGFGTTRHFHRTFVRIQGITPSSYRGRFAPV